MIPLFVQEILDSAEQNASSGSGRRLASLNDINVTRDIVNITILNEHEEGLEYTLNITDWQEDMITIKIDFIAPLLVSSGAYPDILEIKDFNWKIFDET